MKPHPIVAIGCLIVGSLVAWYLSTLASPLTLYPDTAQLVRAVPSLLSGDGYMTSVGWFEAQLMTPLPAPQTVWPPGFPLLTAAIVGVTGIDAAAEVMILIALSSFLLTGALIYLCLREVEIQGTVAALLATAWWCLVPIWLDVVEARSEPLYAALLMLAMLAVLKLRKFPGSGWFWLTAASLATAAAVTVRYQGLVLLAPLFIAVTVATAGAGPSSFTPWRGMRYGILACILPSLTMAALLLRNLPLTGSLTGAAEVGRALRTFTDLADATVWLPQVLKLPVASLMVLGALLLTFIAVRILARRVFGQGRTETVQSPVGSDVAIAYGFVAMGCTVLFIVALGLQSSSYRLDIRYLSTAVPALIVALGAAAHRASSRRRLGIRRYGPFAAAMLVLVVVLQGYLLHPRFSNYVDRLPAPHMKRVLAGEAVAGGSLLESIQHGPLSRSVLMSNLAQELSLLTPATLVGVSAPVFNRRLWDEASVRDLAHRQGVGYLLLFRRNTGSALDFLSKAIADARCCDWLTVEHLSSDVVVARVKRSSGK